MLTVRLRRYSSVAFMTTTVNSTSTITAPTSTATLIYATFVPEGIDSYWFSASWGNEELADLNSVITTLKTYDRAYIGSFDSQASAGRVSDLNLQPSGQYLDMPSGKIVGATDFALVFQGWFWPQEALAPISLTSVALTETALFGSAAMPWRTIGPKAITSPFSWHQARVPCPDSLSTILNQPLH